MLFASICALLISVALCGAALPPDFRLNEYPIYGPPRGPQFTFPLIGYSLAVDPVSDTRYIAGGVPAGVPQIVTSVGIYAATTSSKTSYSREVELVMPGGYTDAIDFGSAVDIYDGYAVASSPSAVNTATFDVGQVFVYQRQSGGWTQQTPVLTITNPTIDACRFGSSLSLFGTALLVGCPASISDNATSAAFLYNVTDGSLLNVFTTADPKFRGYARAVELSSTHAFVSHLFWNNSIAGLLTVYDLIHGQNYTFLGDSSFGRSLSAEGSSVLVGAAGSAYLLGYNETIDAFEIQDTFLPETAADGSTGDFGRSVALYKGRILIGAPVSGGKVAAAGAAQVYARDPDNGNAWGPAIIVGATDGIASGQYGISVALSTNQIFVGSIGGYCQTCVAFTPGVVYVYSQANDCGVPPIPDSPTVCSPLGQILYFNPNLTITTPVVLTNPVIFIGNVSIGANVTAYINGSTAPISAFGCVVVVNGSLKVELTDSVNGNIVIANSRCVNGTFTAVDLTPTLDDCKKYKVKGQQTDVATGSLVLVLDIDSSGCHSDLARKRGIIAGSVVGGTVFLAALVAGFLFLGYKLRWGFLDKLFHQRDDSTVVHV